MGLNMMGKQISVALGVVVGVGMAMLPSAAGAAELTCAAGAVCTYESAEGGTPNSVTYPTPGDCKRTPAARAVANRTDSSVKVYAVGSAGQYEPLVEIQPGGTAQAGVTAGWDASATGGVVCALAPNHNQILLGV
jgi:hypothetical protein